MTGECCVFCEGFLDRSFWKGWLLALGCSDPSNNGKNPVYDLSGERVAGGQFAFISANKRFVRVVPVEGASNLKKAVSAKLKDAVTRNIASIIWNADVEDGPDQAAVEAVARQAGYPISRRPDNLYEVQVDKRALSLGVVTWGCSDQEHRTLPSQQNLERLVCGAINHAYPERGPLVRGWLDSRRIEQEPRPKAFAWSHMAGWYDDRGCDSFHQALWEDELIRSALQDRLVASGAWGTVESLIA